MHLFLTHLSQCVSVDKVTKYQNAWRDYLLYQVCKYISGGSSHAVVGSGYGILTF
jgi:hypothetical protein